MIDGDADGIRGGALPCIDGRLAALDQIA